MFNPPSFEQILANMMNYLRMRTKVTDYNVGSIARTMLEAAALEDDEIYYQMTQILRMFSFMTASGSDLDRRAADFDESRLKAHEAYGELYIWDSGLERTYLNAAATAGGLAIVVNDASVFGAIGLPATFRIGEGTSEEEDVLVPVAGIVGNTINIPAGLVYDHPAAPVVVDEFAANASRISYVSGGADRVISAGLGARKPATGVSETQHFITSEVGTLGNGDFLSDAISARSLQKGKVFNAPARSINEFSANAPYTNTFTVNLEKFGGGRDLQTDDEFRSYLIDKIGSLSKATVLAVTSASAGVTDDDTGQSVTRSKVFEDWLAELVRVYVDDGSGAFVPDTESFIQTTFFANDLIGSNPINLTSDTDFPASGHLVLSPGLANVEIVEYTSINPGGPPYQFNLAAVTTQNHNVGEGAILVEEIEDSTEVGQRYYELDNIAGLPNTLVLFQWPPAATQPTQLVAGTEYYINEGLGQIELVTAPPAGSELYAYYSRYINLVQEVYRVLDGVLDDPVTYPGVRAAGVKMLVQNAVSVLIDVTVALDVAENADKSTLISEAELAVTSYISGLPIGGNVIRNELIQRIMELDEDIIDLTMTTPVGNITVIENEVAVPNNINIT